jgi:hypothetical protein
MPGSQKTYQCSERLERLRGRRLWRRSPRGGLCSIEARGRLGGRWCGTKLAARDVNERAVLLPLAAVVRADGRAGR